MRIARTARTLALAALVAAAVPFAVAAIGHRTGTGAPAPVVVAAKGDRLPLKGCIAEDWPYHSGGCLDGVPPARVVTDRRANTTVLVR